MKNDKRAIIFCSGDLSDVSRIKKYIDKNTFLIGCDGGTAHILSLGLTPHAVIGDFDSIASATKHVLKNKDVDYFRYPKDKIHTDSELGLMLAKERGYTQIIITGFRGTATDHMLGNLFLLFKKPYRGLDIRILDGKEEIRTVYKNIDISGNKDDTVSLVAIGEDAKSVTTTGLFYPLKDATLHVDTSEGLRNHLTGSRAKVGIRKGSLLVIHRVK